MGLDATKPAFGVSDKAGLKPVSSETYSRFFFACSKFQYVTFQEANDKGVDQSTHPKDRFSRIEAHLKATKT